MVGVQADGAVNESDWIREFTFYEKIDPPIAWDRDPAWGPGDCQNVSPTINVSTPGNKGFLGGEFV